MRATRTMGWWISLGLLAAAPLAGCQDDDLVFGEDEETIRFLHDLEGEGPVDVYGDGVLLTRLLPGELSDVIEIDETGLAISFVEVETGRRLVNREIDLTEDQLHIVAVTSEASDPTIDVVVVQTPPPVLGAGEAAVEVLSLLDEGVQVDVFIGNQRAVVRPVPNELVGFFVVDETEDRVRVFATGANPATSSPLTTLRLPLLAGSASLLILTDEVLSGAEPSVAITAVPLR